MWQKMRTIQLNSVNTAVELYGKTHNIIDNYGKHNRAKTRCGKLLRDLFPLEKFLLPSKTSKFLRGVALYWEAY